MEVCSVDRIVGAYQELQPYLASLSNDGVTNAEVLRAVLQSLIEADSTIVSKLKIRPNAECDRIAAYLHAEGKVKVSVGVDETFTIDHKVCLTEAGKRDVEEQRAKKVTHE